MKKKSKQRNGTLRVEGGGILQHRTNAAEIVNAIGENDYTGEGASVKTHQRLYIHKNPCLVVIIKIKKSTCLNMNIISLLSRG